MNYVQLPLHALTTPRGPVPPQGPILQDITLVTGMNDIMIRILRAGNDRFPETLFRHLHDREVKRNTIKIEHLPAQFLMFQNLRAYWNISSKAKARGFVLFPYH